MKTQNKLYKYGRTFHFDFSEGKGSDDKVLHSLDRFKDQDVVITLKLDGENTTIYNDTFHARSLDSRHNESRNWIAKFSSDIGYKIPKDFRICGENLFAKHSIYYDNLESYFYGFSVWNKDICLSWDETILFFNNLEIPTVKELYRGKFDLKIVNDLIKSFDTVNQEGLVCRLSSQFKYDDFSNCMVKWVRKNHIQTTKHWMNEQIKPNKLKGF